MADLKLWTVEDANAALPRLQEMIDDIRNAVGAQRFALGQAADLQHLHGRESVEDAAHPEHEDYARFVQNAEEASARVRRVAKQFADMGIELKDPFTGLVDFPTLRGSEVVYLCWKAGETEVTHWHSMTSGFRGRKPLDALVRAAGR